MRSIAAVVVASSTRNSAALIGYVLNDKKDQRGERYVVATGVNGALVGQAEAQFRDVRKKHGKDRAGQYVQAYHVIQAFAKDGPGALDPDNPDDWLKAHELGRALAKLKAPGREAIVVTQRDGKTGCLHNHIVINSVERTTGRSYNSAWVTHSRLVQEHDTLLAEHGYVQRDDLRQAASDSKERYERGEAAVVRGTGERSNRELRDYAKWLEWDSQRAVAADLGEQFNTVEPFSQDMLTGRVQDAINDPSVSDWDTFVQAGARRGVRISKRGKKNTIRYGMVRTQGTTEVEPTSLQTRRDETLGAQFTLEALEQKWAKAAAQQHDLPVPAPDVATLPQHTEPHDRFADLDAQMKAYLDNSVKALRDELNLGKTLKEIEMEYSAKPAQANTESLSTAEPDKQVSKVAETLTSAPSSTASDRFLPADAKQLHKVAKKFRSRLWGAPVSDPRYQKLIRELATFDENAVALLKRGEMFAEADVPEGIDRKLLDIYGEKMYPDVLRILDQRETKKEAAAALREKSLGKNHSVAQARREKARKIRDEIKAGNYDLDDLKPDYRGFAARNLTEKQAGDNEISLA